MEIYLLRHGSAEQPVLGAPDSERLLTDPGRHEIRRVVSAARLADVRPCLVLASPYKRALETARFAKDLLDCKEPIILTSALTPESDPQSVWEEIRVHHDQPSILLAGHEPLFSTLTAYLLGCPGLQISFPKAGLVRIDVDGFGPQPRGILRWMLTPNLTQ